MTINRDLVFPNASELTIGFINGKYEWQMFVMECFREIAQHVNLKFIFFQNYGDKNGEGNTKYNTTIRIGFGHEDPEWKDLVVCAVGKQAYFYEADKPTMRLNRVATVFNEVDKLKATLDILRVGSSVKEGHDHYGMTADYIKTVMIPYWLGSLKSQILHELLHLLGIEHEQEHPQSGIPYKLKMLTFIQRKDLIATQYDTTSIMHYPSDQYKKFIQYGGVPPVEVGFNHVLSPLDVFSLQTLYPMGPKQREHPIEWDGFVTTPQGIIYDDLSYMNNLQLPPVTTGNQIT